MFRTVFVWAILALLVFSLVHGLVFVAVDLLGPTFPSLLHLETTWTALVDTGVELITFVAPATAWCLHVLGTPALLALRVERALVRVLAWGLLIYPAYALVASVLEAFA